jgi:hypothetical protein
VKVGAYRWWPAVVLHPTKVSILANISPYIIHTVDSAFVTPDSVGSVIFGLVKTGSERCGQVRPLSFVLSVVPSFFQKILTSGLCYLCNFSVFFVLCSNNSLAVFAVQHKIKQPRHKL